MALHLAPGLVLPADSLVNRLAWIGTTNSGKTYAATKCAEQMWHAGMQFAAIDVMGIWYGLRLDKSGEGPGIPITIFGGLHADVPITENDGALVAETIHRERISAIVDLSGLSEDDAPKVRFATQFARRLYALRMKEPAAIHLFIEEAHELLPQNPQAGDAQMLHIWNRLWKQGGNFGIGGSLITQRPQDINKKAADLTACIFAFNTVGTNSVDAMRKWMGGAETAHIQELQQGECIVWSPAWLRIRETFKIDPKETFHARFDPLATLAPATAARVLAPVDIEAMRAAFASSAEAVEADDPKLLRKRIAELEKLVDAKAAASSIDVGAEVEKAVAPLRERIEHDSMLFREFGEIAQRMQSLCHFAARGADEDAAEVSLEIPAELKLPPAEKQVEKLTTEWKPGLTPPEQRIVDTLATFKAIGINSLDRDTLALFVGIAPTTKSHTYAISSLLVGDYLFKPKTGHVALTEWGEGQALPVATVPTRKQLHERWIARLRGKHKMAEILEAMLKVGPSKPVSREDLAATLDLSPTTKSFTYGLSGLHNLGVIRTAGIGLVQLTDLLFPEGLR